MFKTCLIAQGLFALGALAGPAVAGTITLSFQGMGQHQDLVVSQGQHVSASNPHGAVRMLAGENQWQVTVASATGPLQTGSSVRLFALDATSSRGSGVAVIRPLHEAAEFSLADAEARASLLRNLYGLAHHEAGQSSRHAAAFQAAIWEIVHEGGFNAAGPTFAASGLDAAGGAPGQGGFAINTHVGGRRDPVSSLANQWLLASWESWRAGQAGASLAVASGPGMQTQLLVIPLPSAGALAIIGLFGVLGVRRR
jgi:hypothetical protein